MKKLHFLIASNLISYQVISYAQSEPPIIQPVDITVTTVQNSTDYFDRKAVLITNNTNDIVTFSLPVISANLNLINYCGSACASYDTSYPVCSSPISSGAQCLMWFNTLQDTTEALGTVSGTIQIDLNYQDQVISKTVWVEQQTALYATGDFTEVDDSLSVNRIAMWDGTNWYPLGTGVTDRGRDFILYAGNLYLAGEFNNAGNVNNTELVARWNGAQWEALEGGSLSINTSKNPNAYALEIGNSDNRLYVGGTFTNAGTLSANSIASWDATQGQWYALASSQQQIDGYNGVNNTIYDLAQIGNTFYLGGSLTYSNGITSSGSRVTMNKIGAWSPTTSAWTAFTNDGFAKNLHAFYAESNNLYAAGNFITTYENSVTLNHIGVWNGSSWTALGNGLGTNTDELIYAIMRYSLDGLLYAAGSYTSTPSYFASWDGSAWNAVDTGTFNATVRTAIEQGGILYAGGDFNGFLVSNPGGLWQVVGNGANNSVYALWAGTSLQWQ